MPKLTSITFLFMATAISFAGVASAQEQEDETDLDRFIVAEEGAAIVTIAEIEQLAAATREMVAANLCEEAIPQILQVQDSANVASNIIRQGLEPFYRASRDDQDTISRSFGSSFADLANGEAAANRLLRLRNEFWVIEAECLLALGDNEGGVNRLFRALRFIDGVSERELWDRARAPLWERVGYTAE